MIIISEIESSFNEIHREVSLVCISDLVSWVKFVAAWISDQVWDRSSNV